MNKRSILILFLSAILCASASSQSISPQVVNSTGGSYSLGYANVSWSVGEMALVNTFEHPPQFVITNGFLQPFVDKPVGINTTAAFSAEEIKIFPNPATTHVEINFITIQKGQVGLHLYNAAGQKVYEKDFYLLGFGRIEKIDMQRWAAQAFYLHIVFKPETGSGDKQGSYKIIKLR